MLARFGFIFTFAFSSMCFAQVATAPAFLDQKLINPAAAIDRWHLGFEIDVSRSIEKSRVLDLVESSIDIDTTIETLNSNNAFRLGRFAFEINFAPQRGSKDVNSKQDSGGESANVTKLTLAPVQIVTAVAITTNWKAGIKFQYTSFSLNDLTDLNVRTAGDTEIIYDTKNFSGNFIVVGPGVTYSLGKTGISLGYVAEFLQFENQQTIVGSNTKQTLSGNLVTKTDIKSKDTILIRKDVLGIGYEANPKSSNNFRLDFSYEKMPPLTKVEGYPFGEMLRGVAEVSFTFFRIGVEATRKSGYYVDPYKLIPYFFKVDHLGTATIQDFSFFGGLKTAKGHGFGASISQSTADVQEQLSVGSSLQNIEKKSLNIGLSYSYVFL